MKNWILRAAELPRLPAQRLGRFHRDAFERKIGSQHARKRLRLADPTCAPA
jgi:hypothetical protein